MSTFWLVLSGALTGAVGPGISVLYATYGEVITERSGRINLGIEGSMLMGAAFGFIVTVETGNVFIGVLGGSFAGGFLPPDRRAGSKLRRPPRWRSCNDMLGCTA